MNSNHQISIIVRGNGPLVPEFQAIGETLVLPGGGFEPSSSRISGLARRAKNRLFHASPFARLDRWQKRRWDLIYSNTVTNGDLVSRFANGNVPVITHVHEMKYWITQSGTKNWEEVKRHSSRFIAASRAVMDTLVSELKLNADSVDIVHESVDVVHTFVADAPSCEVHSPSEVRKKLGIPSNAFIVGGSGAESWRKGKDLFVQLAGVLARRCPDKELHFLWVGNQGTSAERYQLDHDASLAGVRDRVHWVGEVSDPRPYFSEFGAFVLVSREDPFPLVCLEAAALGKPIVCFDGAGGAPELVEDGAGYVVPYLDVSAMADRLVDLIQDPGLARSLGFRGQQRVSQQYTVNQRGPQILGIIETELARANGSK